MNFKSMGIEELHRGRNASTQEAGGHFAPHRDRVMKLLVKAAAFLNATSHPAGFPDAAENRLAVIGSGNCNDLDLTVLASLFTTVVLADIDTRASQAAVDRQISHEQLKDRFLVQYADASGVVETLNRFSESQELSRPATTEPARTEPARTKIVRAASEQSASERSFECAATSQNALQLTNFHEAVRRELERSCLSRLQPEGFQCVLSLCVLSQLIDSLVITSGGDSEQLVDLIQLQRRQHLHYLINSLAPGGVGLLVFDFLASTTVPDLMHIPDPQLLPRITEAIAAQNFFTGLNPFIIHQQLLNDAEFQSQVAHVQLQAPWRWSIGEKQFAVTAISFQRK